MNSNFQHADVKDIILIVDEFIEKLDFNIIVTIIEKYKCNFTTCFLVYN